MRLLSRYFVREMLAAAGKSFDGVTVAISGSGNVAQYACEQLIVLGAKPITLSDSSGFIHDSDGITQEKLEYVKELKNNELSEDFYFVDGDSLDNDNIFFLATKENIKKLEKRYPNGFEVLRSEVREKGDI